MYVGENGRQLSDRIKEHKIDVQKQKLTSSVYNHVNLTGHSYNFDEHNFLNLNN
mgnify:CR=1 FL=1